MKEQNVGELKSEWESGDIGDVPALYLYDSTEATSIPPWGLKSPHL